MIVNRHNIHEVVRIYNFLHFQNIPIVFGMVLNQYSKYAHLHSFKIRYIIRLELATKQTVFIDK